MAKSSLGDGTYIHPRKISKIDSLQKGKYHLKFYTTHERIDSVIPINDNID